MKKIFVLSEVIDREITTPKIFPDFDSAMVKLAEYVAQAFDLEEDAVINKLFFEKINDNFTVEGYGETVIVYGTNHGQDYDWKLQPITFDF